MGIWDVIAGSGLAGLGANMYRRSSGNPAGSAMPYLDQISGVGHQYYDPYVSQGKQAGQAVSGQYEKLMNDPTAFLNALMQGYKPSQGYTDKSEQMLKQARNAAAAGGKVGTEYDQRQQAELVQSLLGNDMQQYLQNVMGLYGQGLQGQQRIADMGYDASGQLANYLGQGLGSQASLAYQGKAGQNAQRSNLLNALLGAGAQGAGAYYGYKGMQDLANAQRSTGYHPLGGNNQGWGW